MRPPFNRGKVSAPLQFIMALGKLIIEAMFNPLL